MKTIILFVCSGLGLLSFQNCGNVNLLNPASTAPAPTPPPDPVQQQAPAPTPTPLLTPTPTPTPALLVQPAANPITDQSRLPANLPVPVGWTRSVPRFENTAPANVQSACSSYSNIFFLEMPWLPVNAGTQQQIGMVVTPSTANSVVVLHAFVPSTTGPFTVGGVTVNDSTSFLRFRFAEAPWAQMYDRKSNASGTPCNFGGVIADNSSDRIVGVAPNPASYSPVMARGQDVYYSIETPKGPEADVCEQNATNPGLRKCDFIIQVMFGSN